jgi:hypothetical protein
MHAHRTRCCRTVNAHERDTDADVDAECIRHRPWLRHLARAALERPKPLEAHVGRLAGKLAPKRAAR